MATGPADVCAANQQLKRGSVGAQDDMLTPAYVNMNVLEARQGRNNGVRSVTPVGTYGLGDGRQQRGGCTSLGQPNVARFQSGAGWVSESYRAPTPQQAARAPASA